MKQLTRLTPVSQKGPRQIAVHGHLIMHGEINCMDREYRANHNDVKLCFKILLCHCLNVSFSFPQNHIDLDFKKYSHFFFFCPDVSYRTTNYIFFLEGKKKHI